MPVTGVVGDDVDDDLDAVRVQIGDEREYRIALWAFACRRKMYR
mgnify:CR=1 FL=1